MPPPQKDGDEPNSRYWLFHYKYIIEIEYWKIRINFVQLVHARVDVIQW